MATDAGDNYVKASAQKLRVMFQRGALANSVSPDLLAYCSSCMETMYRSRDVLTSDVQRQVAWLIGVLSAFGIVANYSVASESAYVRLGGSFFLLAISWSARRIAESSRATVRAAYDLYTSSIVHAAIVHEAAGMRGTHRWFEAVVSMAEIEGFFGIAHKSYAERWRPKRIGWFSWRVWWRGKTGLKDLIDHNRRERATLFPWIAFDLEKRAFATESPECKCGRGGLWPLVWDNTVLQVDGRRPSSATDLVAVWRQDGFNVLRASERLFSTAGTLSVCGFCVSFILIAVALSEFACRFAETCW